MRRGMISTPLPTPEEVPSLYPPATPATVKLLLVMAATVPATWVPCPSPSSGSLSAVPQSWSRQVTPAPEVLSTKSQPMVSSTNPLPSSSTPLFGISAGLTQMLPLSWGASGPHKALGPPRSM